jgi:hypothetical protein
MAKKTISEMQDIILNGFDRAIRAEKRNPQPSQIERLIAESAAKNAAHAAKLAKQPAQPFISFYNPHNPLNALKGLRGVAYKEKYAELKKAGLLSK